MIDLTFFKKSGVVTSEGTSLIEKEFCTRFFQKELWTADPHRSVPHVFITCDPNTSNTSTSADMALVATIAVHGTRVVSLFFL